MYPTAAYAADILGVEFPMNAQIDMPDRQPQFVHPKVFEAMYRAAAAEIAAWINCY